MKRNYLLESYDFLIQQVKNPYTLQDGLISNVLEKHESDSYRVYEIKIDHNNQGEESITVCPPIHSLHPKNKRVELKTIFQINGAEKYLPILKTRIKFTGEPVYFANSFSSNDTIWLYEKCSIRELNKNEKFFLFCYLFLNEKNSEIKTAIKENVFNLKSQTKIENYIHKVQVSIEKLLNFLIEIINPEENNDIYDYSGKSNKSDCYKVIFSELEKLQLFLETEYSEYCNPGIKVPRKSILASQSITNPKLEYVRNTLLSWELDNTLLQIAFEPILLLSNLSIQEQISYHQFKYAGEYIFELATLIKNHKEIIKEEDLCNWLIDLNLNSFRLFDYKINKIQLQLQTFDSEIEKLNYLYNLLKYYNQKRNKVNRSFKEKLPEIRIQLSNWIEEEIIYINRKINLESGRADANLVKTPSIKIETGFSVAQLIYFVNLLVQVGIIKHNNLRDIFRLIADNFKTKNTETISIDSLSSKFYNVETGTKEAVREKIIELLNRSKG